MNNLFKENNVSKKRGVLIILSGPSGAGKDTVLKEILSLSDDIKVSISATTRKPRDGEQDGKDYYFLTKEEFLETVENGGMLEYVKYCGNYYGTPKAPVDSWLDEGKSVVLEIEVKGEEKIKKQNPEAVSIFILPPSFSILEERLRKRNTDSDEAILERLKTAKDEVKKAYDYDYVVINDTLENCYKSIFNIIESEKMKSWRMKNIIERVIEND